MPHQADSASGYRVAAVATLAAGVAGLTMLAGVVRLRIPALRARPLIAVEPLPAPTWPHTWLGAMQSAQQQQSDQPRPCVATVAPVAKHEHRHRQAE